MEFYLICSNSSDACCLLGNAAAGMEVGVGISQVTNTKCQELLQGTTLKCVMVRVKDMAATLLTVMLVIPYICEGALLKKSTATDFLQKAREKRSSECFPGGCSPEVSETSELMETNVGYEDRSSPLFDGGAAQKEASFQTPGGEAATDEGSGM